MRPIWLVCEDGAEYTDRMTRFLGQRYSFERTSNAAELMAALASLRDSAAGIVMDVDFSRAPSEALIDEEGATSGFRSAQERVRLSEVQGILILRNLRQRGVVLPVLLCADLDQEHTLYLEGSFPPLEVVPSSESLLDLGKRLDRWSGRRRLPP